MSTEQAPRSPWWESLWLLVGLSIAITIAVMLSIDPSGHYPASFEGPGITTDEIFNVQQGVLQVKLLQAYNIALINPLSWCDLYSNEMYLPDHPPLGRYWLGMFHELAQTALPPQTEQPFVIAAARFGSAVGFGLVVFLTGGITRRWASPLAGLIAALATAFIPRLWGHAHIASLEIPVMLTYLGVVGYLGTVWAKEQGKPSLKPLLIGSLLLGVALLTKIQGVLLTVPVGLWLLLWWRVKGVQTALLWGLCGGLAFFIGWPWLWLDPVNHTMEYLGRSTDRISLPVWYFGQQYADTETPWHYPWVMTLVTMPLTHWLLMGGLAFRQQISAEKPADEQADEDQSLLAKRLSLTAIVALFPLLLFSTHVAIYDGIRLFSMSFPLLAILVGVGAERWIACFRPHQQRIAMLTILAVLFTNVGFLWRTHPVSLSSYNVLAGSLASSPETGFELNYWNDSWTRSFMQKALAEIEPGSLVLVEPVLHQFQLIEITRQYPGWSNAIALQSPEQRTQHADPNQTLLVAGQQGKTLQSSRPQYLMIFSRRANLNQGFYEQANWQTGELPLWGQPVVSYSREGVVLAALYKLNSETMDLRNDQPMD